MTALPVKIIGAAVAGTIVLGLWAFFAPTKLGGSTTYSVTAGISMEPLLHKDDLAFVRARSSYHVGDVVLYQSSVLHRPVLHRILRIQHGKYYFKGDNNGFVDPGYAKPGELVGSLWFSVPAVGSVLSWFGKPAHAALLVALVAMVVVLTGVSTTKSRRRRRRGSKAMKRPKINAKPLGPPARASSDEAGRSPQPTFKRRPPPYLDGPNSTLVAMGVVLTLAVLMLGMGFSRPTQRIGVRSDAFSQAGTFSYSATPNAPTAVYPAGVLKTGDPIYPSLVGAISMHFGYRFTSSLPHHIKGTIEMRALLLSKTDTWQELSTVVPVTRFSGDATSVTSDLPLAALYDLIDSVATQSGIAGGNYAADIQPVIHVTGTVGGQRIDEKFSPVLPFAVSKSAITLDVAAAAPPPGATFAPSSAGSAVAAALHPAQTGTIPDLVGNTVSIAKYDVGVSLLRYLGMALGVLVLVLALVHDRRRRRGPRRSEEEQIARRSHVLIVPVAHLGSTAGHTPIVVPDFASLAGLARFLERPILYEVRDGNRTFAVDDDGLRYLTSAIDRRGPWAQSDPGPGDAVPTPAAPTPAEPEPASRAARPHRITVSGGGSASHRSTTRSTVARVATGLLVIAVAATLTVSFTASTTVPASRAGRSVQTRLYSQEAPAGCSTVAAGLTSLVRNSGTFSNSTSNALILGSAGVDRITDTGNNNCVVGGGGKDNVTARSTSVCIIGPTGGTSYSGCTKRS